MVSKVKTRYISQASKISLDWTVKKGVGFALEDFSRSAVSLFLVGGGDRISVRCTAGLGHVWAEISEELPEAVYSLELLWVKNGDIHRTRCLQRSRVDEVFCITRNESEAETQQTTAKIEVTTHAHAYGYDGLSAYEAAVLRGYRGSENEYWNSVFSYEIVNEQDGFELLDDGKLRIVKESADSSTFKSLYFGNKLINLHAIPAEHLALLSELVKSGITTGLLSDGAVTSAKIRNGAVEWEKLGVTAVKELVSVMRAQINEAIASISITNISGNVTNNPDEEYFTAKDVGGVSVLTPKNKAYAPLLYSGKGRTYLRKNLRGGVNMLTQAMVPDANTIYEIQYDYDLNGATLTIPEGCTLHFDGGSIYHGTVVWNDTLLTGDVIMSDITVAGGRLRNNEVYVDWFGTDGTGAVDDSYPILAAIASLKKDGGTLIFGENKTYLHGDGIEDAETGTGMNYVNVFLGTTPDGVNRYTPDSDVVEGAGVVPSDVEMGRDIRLFFEDFYNLTIDGKGATIISHEDNGVTTCNSCLWLVGCSNVNVKNLTIDGNKEARFAKLGVAYSDHNSGQGYVDWSNINVRYSQNVTFEGVNSLNSCHNGFDFKPAYVYSSGFNVRYSYRSATPPDAVRLPDRYIENVSMFNCSVGKCWKNGIGCSTMRGLLVQGGKFINCGTGSAMSPKSSIDLEFEGKYVLSDVSIRNVEFTQELDVQTEVVGELYIMSGAQNISVQSCTFNNCGCIISGSKRETAGIRLDTCRFKNASMIISAPACEVNGCLFGYDVNFVEYNGREVIRKTGPAILSKGTPVNMDKGTVFANCVITWDSSLDSFTQSFKFNGDVINNEFRGLCGGGDYLFDMSPTKIEGNKFTTYQRVYQNGEWTWISPEITRPPVIMCRKMPEQTSGNTFEGDIYLASGTFLPMAGPDFQSKSKLYVTRSILLKPTENYIRIPLPFGNSRLNIHVAILNEKVDGSAATRYIYSSYKEVKAKGFFVMDELITNFKIRHTASMKDIILDFSDVAFNANASRWIWFSIEADFCLYNPSLWKGVEVLTDDPATVATWSRLYKSGPFASRPAIGAITRDSYPDGYRYYCTDIGRYIILEKTTVANGVWRWENGYNVTIPISGITSQRPTASLTATDSGFQYFDTTLGKPIYWTGTAWVDATGTAV